MVDLRLLIVAADPLARAGLATLLESTLQQSRPEVRIVGQIGVAETTPAEIEIYQPDIVLWDLGWDPEESLTLLEELELGEVEGSLAVVALAPNEEAATVAWSAGVRGLLYREVSGERLLAAIEAVYWGLIAVEPELMALLAPAGVLAEPPLAEELTPRELEVLRLLAEGLSNKAIAQQLDISDHTVKFHVNAIMKKLGAQSRTAAVVQATRLGLIVL
jgi:two-component system nitrate/nitrite response regulator NarL